MSVRLVRLAVVLARCVWAPRPALLLTRTMTASPKKKALRALAGENATRPGAKVFERFSVAIVGRPNVGKSSLFNRLSRQRLALVDRDAGTTRDWKEADGALGDLRFAVMDTGGLEDRPVRDTIESKMLAHTATAIHAADAVLFVIDGRAGVTAEDERFAQWLKRLRPRGGVHLIANKTEGWVGHVDGEERWEQLVTDSYVLALGEPVPVSAAHGDGLMALYRVLEPYGLVIGSGSTGSDGGSALREVPVSTPPATQPVLVSHNLPANASKRQAVLDRLARADGTIQLAVVGRPNAGKSTLVNQLMG